MTLNEQPQCGDMQTTINRQLLAFAVRTAIFCPRCRQVLDVRDAVQSTIAENGREREYIMCGKCWNDVKRALWDMVTQSGGALTMTALDGRELNPRRARKEGAR